MSNLSEELPSGSSEYNPYKENQGCFGFLFFGRNPEGSVPSSRDVAPPPASVPSEQGGGVRHMQQTAKDWKGYHGQGSGDERSGGRKEQRASKEGKMVEVRGMEGFGDGVNQRIPDEDGFADWGKPKVKGERYK